MKKFAMHLVAPFVSPCLLPVEYFGSCSLINHLFYFYSSVETLLTMILLRIHLVLSELGSD